MSGISSKKHLARTLVEVIRSADEDAAQLAGQSWPCSVAEVNGAIVTINFEVSSSFTLPRVTVPIAESRYVRLPVQVGDKGFVVPATARLGGVTGLGAGLAPLTPPTNLGGLVFVPLGNSEWTTIDANAVVLQAPNGVKLLTDNSASELILDTSQVKVTQGDVTVEITGGVVTVTADHVVINATDSTFNGNVIVTGNVSVDGSVVIDQNLQVGLAISSQSLTVSGAAAVGSLTIDGKPYASHEHAAGTYHIGSSNVAGDSGAPI